MIRLIIPSLDASDQEAVSQVLATGYLVQGQHVVEFEDVVAAQVGVPHAIAVSNCTAALHLALLGLGVRPGDIVVTTTYSWIATANVIALCEAQPVFVDVEPDNFNIDLNLLADTLKNLTQNATTARRLKAILPVHTFGQPADMADIMTLAERYNLPVVEDAACALGASLQNRQAGAWGDVGCFSFHPRKAITTGEGGIITTADAELAHRMQILRNHGQDPLTKPTEFVEPGFNYRLTDFQAALGVNQMGKLERIIAARQKSASYYDHLLADTPIQAPIIKAERTSVYQSYVVLLPPNLASKRSELIQYLYQQGSQSTIGTLHMPLTAYFRTRYGYQVGDFPVTDDIAGRALTLPLYEGLTEAEQSQVVEAILAFEDMHYVG